MSESTKDEFNRLARQLLERDGKRLDNVLDEGDAVIWVIVLEVDEMRLMLDSRDKLRATLPSNLNNTLPGFRLQVYCDQNREFSTRHMSDWIPRLRRRLVLEQLSEIPE